jgi:hypothetical protein
MTKRHLSVYVSADMDIGNWMVNSDGIQYPSYLLMHLYTKCCACFISAAASSHACLQIGGPGYLTWVTGNRVVPFDENAPPSNFTQRDMVAAVEGSLRRLQTDYIDLYQLHWPARYVPVFGFKQYRPENIRECLDFEEQVGNAL